MESTYTSLLPQLSSVIAVVGFLFCIYAYIVNRNLKSKAHQAQSSNSRQNS